MNGAPAMTACVALAALWGSGCGERGAPAVPVSSRVSRGPVALLVEASPPEVAVGEAIRLTVEVDAQEGVEVTMPRIGEALGPFAVRPGPRPRATSAANPAAPLRQVYLLDTFDAGECEIPPITVAWVDRRPETLARHGAPLPGELSSDSLSVEVRSVLPPGAPRDILGAVDVPLAEGPSRWLWLAALPVAALACWAVLGVLRHRRRKVAAAPPVPAHVRALEELDRLAAEGLVDAGRLHEFYHRLSDVVRRYVEGRFGLMAPERTTQEFLREARRSGALAEDHKTLLADFLRAADLVKFALHRPGDQEAHDALRAARGFVAQTAPRAGGAEEAA